MHQRCVEIVIFSGGILMKIFDLKEKLEFIDEVAKLEYEEWADNKEENKLERIKRKKRKNKYHVYK